MKTKIFQLSDLVTIKYGKNQKKVEEENGEYPIYGTGGLMGHASQFLYDKPSVLIGRKGTIDKVRYVDHPFWTVDTLFYTIVNEDLVIPKYLYYLMSTMDMKQYNEGTTIPSLRTETLNRIELEIPSLEDQKKILDCLNPLDDKVNTNNAINRNLYEQCVALYSELFEGKEWNEDTLENCTSQIIRGKSGEYVEHSKYANLNQKVNKGFILEKQYYKYLDESIEIPDEKFGRPKDIILNSLGQGTLGRVHFLFDVEPNVVIDQHISIIRTNERMTPEYLYFMLASAKYQDIINNSVAGSTGMLMLNISVVRALKIDVPPIEKQKEFSKIVEPMYAIIEKHNSENETLAALRDNLLSKLMSGELDVSDLDI